MPIHRAALLLLFAALLACLGCAPDIAWHATTSIDDTGLTHRRIRITATAAEGQKQHHVNLNTHLEWPAEGYAVVEQAADRLHLLGTFPSPMDVPPDFRKRTAATQRLATNRITYNRLDCILFTMIEYEETFSDILERERADAAMEVLIRYLQALSGAALHPVFEERYDIRHWEHFTTFEAPAHLRRLYGTIWDIQRAHNDAVDTAARTAEYRALFRSEATRQGLPLPPEATSWNEIPAATLTAFADRKLRAWFPPRFPQTPPVTTATFGQGDVQRNLMDALAKADKPLPRLLGDLEAHLPRVGGAFLPAILERHPSYPRFTFTHHLRLPGEVIQTNGILNPDGSISWRFTGYDIALAGKSLTARTRLPHPDPPTMPVDGAFPVTAADALLLRRALYTPDGTPRTGVAAALRTALDDGTLLPLKTHRATVEIPDDARALDALLLRLTAPHDMPQWEDD